MSSYYHHDPFEAKDYLKAIGLGIVIFLLAIYLQKYVEEELVKPIFSLLSNASLAAGGLLLGGGVLSWVKKEGMFDIFSFGFKQAFNTIAGMVSTSYSYREGLDYFEYRKEMAEKRRVNLPWIIVGAGFILISIVFTVLFFFC